MQDIQDKTKEAPAKSATVSGLSPQNALTTGKNLPSRLRPVLRQAWIMEQIKTGLGYGAIIAAGIAKYGVSERTLQTDHAEAVKRLQTVGSTTAEAILPEILDNLRELYLLAIDKGDLSFALQVVEKKARYFGVIGQEPGSESTSGGPVITKYQIIMDGTNN